MRPQNVGKMIAAVRTRCGHFAERTGTVVGPGCENMRTETGRVQGYSTAQDR